MRWARQAIHMILAVSALLVPQLLHAGSAPTHRYVLEADADRLAARSEGPVDLEKAMHEAIEVAHARLEGLEDGAYRLEHEGEGRLVFEITAPGAPRIVRDVFGIIGDLDFLPVDPDATPDEIAQGIARSGSAIYPQDNREEAIAVRLDGGVSGESLTSALASIDPMTADAVVNLQFDEVGKQRLAALTRANIGRPMAIVLDGRVLSAPIIVTPILGGHAQISGSFTQDEASTLAIQLRSGALPTPFTIVEESIIVSEMPPSHGDTM